MIDSEVFSGEKSLILCCSGGPDSMAMTFSVIDHFKFNSEIKISILIIDHQLEELSALRAWKTALFLLDNLSTSILILEVTKVKKEKGGYEASARDARYTIINSYKKRFNASAVLAHTENDQAECVLLALLRGSGINSLKGMYRKLNGYIRPFLSIKKDKLKRYCDDRKIFYYTDRSNYSLEYARASIRQLLIPIYSSIMKQDIIHNLSKTATLLQDEKKANDILREKFFPQFNQYILIQKNQLLFTALNKLKKENSVLRKIYLKFILSEYYSLNNFPKDKIGYEHIKKLETFLFNPYVKTKSKIYNLPENVFLKTMKNNFLIYKKSE